MHKIIRKLLKPIASAICCLTCCNALYGTENRGFDYPKSDEQETSFNYVGVGVSLPIPVPGITFGHREKFEGSALDMSAGISTLLLASSISISGKYLQYLNNESYYLGAGATLSLLIAPGVAGYGISPIGTFGKESEKRFHQVDFGVIHFSSGAFAIAPSCSYRYGIKF